MKLPLAHSEQAETSTAFAFQRVGLATCILLAPLSITLYLVSWEGNQRAADASSHQCNGWSDRQHTALHRRHPCRAGHAHTQRSGIANAITRLGAQRRFGREHTGSSCSERLALSCVHVASDKHHLLSADERTTARKESAMRVPLHLRPFTSEEERVISKLARSQSASKRLVERAFLHLILFSEPSAALSSLMPD